MTTEAVEHVDDILADEGESLHEIEAREGQQRADLLYGDIEPETAEDLDEPAETAETAETPEPESSDDYSAAYQDAQTDLALQAQANTFAADLLKRCAAAGIDVQQAAAYMRAGRTLEVIQAYEANARKIINSLEDKAQKQAALTELRELVERDAQTIQALAQTRAMRIAETTARTQRKEASALLKKRPEYRDPEFQRRAVQRARELEIPDEIIADPTTDHRVWVMVADSLKADELKADELKAAKPERSQKPAFTVPKTARRPKPKPKPELSRIDQRRAKIDALYSRDKVTPIRRKTAAANDMIAILYGQTG